MPAPHLKRQNRSHPLDRKEEISYTLLGILSMSGRLGRGKADGMNALILQSDFGYADGAVSAMVGVAVSVCSELRIYDLTHDIPPYDIWEASNRLIQTIGYWPAGSVFVSVVDPGVGSTRRSVAVRMTGGQVLISPDNGTLTHLMQHGAVAQAREIDESVNRLPDSGESYTFHGRDIYAYTGARLASGRITFEEIGPEIPVESLVSLPVVKPRVQDGRVSGTIDVLDVRFGSLWTNIPRELFIVLGVRHGDRVTVRISHYDRVLYQTVMVYARSFADVNIGEPLLYANSLDCMAVAINQGSFSRAYGVGTGISWVIELIPTAAERA